MPPSISRTPDFSNQFAFPVEAWEIGIPLYNKKSIITNLLARRYEFYVLLTKLYLTSEWSSLMRYCEIPWDIIYLAPLFSQLKVLDIFSINSFSVATFMYSYHHNLLPNSFHDLFLSSNQVHQYETRLASQYRPHFCRTNIKQFSILYRGPKIWNSLPVSLISSPSISVFKKI